MWLHRNKGEIGVTPSNETNTNLIVVDTIQSFTGDVLTFFDNVTTGAEPNSFTGFMPVFDGGIFRFQTGILNGTSDKESYNIKWTVTPSVNTKQFTVRFRKAGTNEVQQAQYWNLILKLMYLTPLMVIM